MKRSTALIIVLALVLASVATPLSTASVPRVNIDADHPLTDSDHIDAYESDGHTSANLTRLDMSITYADSDEHIAIDDPAGKDAYREYLQFCYREDISREIRVYIPRQYVTPVNEDGLEDLNHGVPADLDPAQNRAYTAVTVTLDKPGCYVWPVNIGDAAVWGQVEDAKRRVSKALPTVDVPMIGDSPEWRHINSGALDNQTAVQINARSTENVVVQYQTIDRDGDTRWVNAPKEQTETAPVYVMTRGNETYVIASANDPPQVRWKPGGKTGALSNFLSDVGAAFEKTLEDLGIN